MENLIKEVTTIRSSVRSMRMLTIFSLAISAVVVLGAIAMNMWYAREMTSNIYVLDKGMIGTATLNTSGDQRKLEVEDHVVRFHELMMNLSPSGESIKSNIERALTMSDKSAYDYWQDLSEAGFYNRLVSANISQQFTVDSLKSDIGVYPYQAEVYGKLYLIRESNITAYSLHTSCQMVDVGRSKTNPHGLMVEKFRVVSNEKIGTRKRN